MLKEKILETINKNQAYRDIVQPTSEAEEFSSAGLYSVYSEGNVPEEDDEPLTFKDTILAKINANRYFRLLVDYNLDGEIGEVESDFKELAKFASIDDKVIMSADNKIIAARA